MLNNILNSFCIKYGDEFVIKYGDDITSKTYKFVLDDIYSFALYKKVYDKWEYVSETVTAGILLDVMKNRCTFIPKRK